MVTHQMKRRGVLTGICCLFLLMPVMSQATPSPEACGRRIIRKALEARRMGLPTYMLPYGCERVQIPPDYYAVPVSGGAFRIHETATDKVLVVITPPPGAPREKDGVVGSEVWEGGKLKGRVTIHD